MFLRPASVFLMERVSEHQFTPSCCPTCQEARGGGEGEENQSEGWRYITGLSNQNKSKHSKLSPPFLPQGVQNQQRAVKVLLEEERECNAVRAGCFTHTPSSPELTQTQLTHLQTTEPRRRPSPTRPCIEGSVGCTQPDAATSSFPGGGGEAGRQLEIHNHQERGERRSLSLFHLLSVSASSPSIYPFSLQLRTSKWQSHYPSHAQSG